MIRKEEIHQRIWPDTFVEEANLSVHISELRAALGDDSKEPRFIRTVHRYGNGFVSAVQIGDLTLAPNGFKLIGSIANAIPGSDRANLGDLHNMTVEFNVTDGTGRVVPFISSVVNGSGDSTFRVN